MSELIARSMFDSQADAENYIASCEGAFRTCVKQIAEKILSHPEVRMLGLCGPTCAGKSTAAKLLIRHLEAAGKHVHMISIDDFFREQPHARALMQEADGHQKLDFDSFDALDFPLLRTCVISLMTRGYAKMPCYDLSRGLRCGARELIVRDDNDIFLFEGIQTVYPQINALLREYPYFSMYISVARSLIVGGVTYEPHQIRLLRRLVRDHYRRSSPPVFTFFAWDSVRKNEIDNILPYADQCDVQMDSLMGYEISMLRPYLEQILPTLPANDSHCEVAARILLNIKKVQPLSDTLLSEDSLYREFVGAH